MILAETALKNLCSDHSWKHPHDERDERRSSRSLQNSFIRTRFSGDMFDCDFRGAVCGSYTDHASLSTSKDSTVQSHNPVSRLSRECQNPKFRKMIENVNRICLNSWRPWHFRMKFRWHLLVYFRGQSNRSQKQFHGLPVSQKSARLALVADSFFARRAGRHSLRARCHSCTPVFIFIVL